MLNVSEKSSTDDLMLKFREFWKSMQIIFSKKRDRSFHKR